MLGILSVFFMLGVLFLGGCAEKEAPVVTEYVVTYDADGGKWENGDETTR